MRARLWQGSALLVAALQLLVLLALCLPRQAEAATQSFTYNCNGNYAANATSPGDTLLITLGANCVLESAANVTNMTINSITSSTGVSKTVSYKTGGSGTTYSTGDVFNVTIGSSTGVNSKITFHAPGVPNTLYGTYALTPSAPVTGTLTPSSGTADGGTSVNISCTSQCWNFATSASLITSVTFGGVAASSFAASGNSAIVAVSPAGTIGTASVVLTNINGSSTPLTFTYLAPPPTVTAVTPSSGPLAGGSSITITGTNFTNVSAVKISGTAVTSYSVVNDTTITAVTPSSGTSGSKSVVVTTLSGSNSANTLYSYQAQPSVSSFTPTTGSTLGGTVITITGTNFSNVSGVTVGGTAATAYTVNSSTQITATVPAGTAGSASVVVTTSGGSITAGTSFTYTRANQSSLSLSAGQSSINTGATTTVTPAGGSGSGAVSYSSSNAGVATVDASTGVVTGVSAGSATITATKAQDSTYNAATATASITVTATPTPVLTFGTPTSATVVMGSTLSNVATSTLSGGSYGAISYSSASTGVATVDTSTGVVTPVAVGTVTITATQAAAVGFNTSATRSYSLAVNRATQATLTASTSAASIATRLGSATISATGGSGTGSLSYAISSGSCSIDASTGVLTAGGVAETCQVTATKAADATYAAQTATVSVTVFLPTPTLTFSTPSPGSLAIGATLSNPATSTLSGGSYGAIAYSSANTGVATVDTSTGVVTPVSVGTVTITATQAAATGYNASATQSYALAITSTNASLANLQISTGTLSPAFASGTISYAVTVAHATSSITLTPTLSDVNASVKVNGVTVASGAASANLALVEGSNTITVLVTAQDGSTTQTYSVLVTRAALLAQATFTVSASPTSLTSSVTTSTLSTSGGSGSGAVSFARSAGSCSLSGSTVTAGNVVETCSFTATKAGDTVYASATASVSISVSRRRALSDAAQDASVSRSLTSQIRQTQRFVQSQVQNISQHLEHFRHGFTLPSHDMRLGWRVQGMEPLQPFISLAQQKLALSDRDASRNEGQRPDPAISPAYSLWSAGTIEFNRFAPSASGERQNTIRVEALTLGLDYKPSDRVIVGAALSWGNGADKEGDALGITRSKHQALSGYGITDLGQGWKLDGVLGYSHSAFSGTRTPSDAAISLPLQRNGATLHGSGGLSKSFEWSAWRLSPFVRTDASAIRLNAYEEKGDADYALGFSRTQLLTSTTSVGLMVGREMNLQRGKLVLSARLHGQWTRNGALDQGIYYADEGSAAGVFTARQLAERQHGRTIGLGLQYLLPAGEAVDLSWTGSIGSPSEWRQGLRLGIRLPI